MPAQLYLSIGYDTERPRGEFATTDEGRQERRRILRFISLISTLYRELSLPRTHYCLGEAFHYHFQDVGADYLRRVMDVGNEDVEVANHTYSHVPAKYLSEYPRGTRILTSKEFEEDARLANDTLEEVLGVVPEAMRFCYCHDTDLSDNRDLLEALRRVGLRYISSWGRSAGLKNALFGDVSLERQPKPYAMQGYPDIIELPVHGWQDIIFLPEKAKQFRRTDLLDTKSHLSSRILAEYIAVLEQAMSLATQEGSPDKIAVSLCMHPWAVMEWDPDLSITRRLLTKATSNTFQVVTQGQLAKLFE